MPDRILRSGLIWSERVASISSNAELLFVRLLLIADDFGLVDLSPATIKLRALPGRDFTVAQITDYCGELVRVGLLRAYSIGGKPLGAIDHWNQSRWAKTSKYPMPPWGEEHIDGGYVAPRARLHQAPAPAPEAPKTNVKPKGNGAKPPADSGFDAFWAAYPRHVARAPAAKAWGKLAPDNALQGAILEALALQSASPDWKRENGKYIPHPATWLNARRWEDETAPRPEERFPI